MRDQMWYCARGRLLQLVSGSGEVCGCAARSRSRLGRNAGALLEEEWDGPPLVVKEQG